jgi:hypothetical protein
MSLTKAELKNAVELHESGQTRPEGVSWSPYRIPQFLSTKEDEEYNSTGVMPKSALDRYQTELDVMKAYSASGEELSAKDKEKALSGITGGARTPVESETATTESDESTTTTPTRHRASR